ncbi:hypothetical protein [Spirosoma agri]|uniref:Uncharacterized protein n=1 Tax=Spirosoma agri TaxID=1987381 RepID=A0A6M0IKM1_9BACT|nr:hypothetical protein [Spirosoma agri]NEU67921.1 hypothetical protein [Spirosoma agri]
MFSDHIDYYYQAVKPNFEEYFELSKTINEVGGNQLPDAAMKSAGSLFHFRDHLLSLYGDSFSRKYVASLCSDFDIVGDVYNSTKHKEISRKERLIQGSTSILKGFFVSRFKDEMGIYQVHRPAVLIKPLKGKEFDFLKPVTNVYNFWTKFMYDKGLLEKVDYYTFEGDSPVSRQSVPKSLDGMKTEMPRYKKAEDLLLIIRTYDYINNKFIYE